MDDYVEHLQDLFRSFGPVTIRRMFGGYGLFHDGLMFALVADGVLFLKADDDNRRDFEQAGLPAFEYDKRGKRVTLSYYQAPAELLEDPELAAQWASRSYDAALRSNRQRPSRKK